MDHDLILFILFFILEKGKGKEKERKRKIDWLPYICAPNGDCTRNPGVCPYRESNWRPLSWQDDAQLSYTSQGFYYCYFYF